MTYEAIVQPTAYGNPQSILDMMSDMRANAPVARVTPDDYEPFYVVSKYDDIKFVEMNPDKFIAGPRSTLNSLSAEAAYAEKYGTRNTLVTLVHMDGEMHRLHRNVSRDLFLPAKVNALEDQIAGQAKYFVDQMAAMGGECDFAADIAFWFPLRVIMSLIGVPQEDEKQIMLWTQQMFGSQDKEFAVAGDDHGKSITAVLDDLLGYFAAMAEDRQKNPRDDIASLLANAEIEGKPMGEREMFSYFIIAATAGHDTTSATIAGGMQALVEHPDQLARLQGDLSLLPAAVDEMIRWVCPVKHFVRTATEDVVIGETEVKKGESVALLFWSACRDESIFENPHEFNIERQPNKHLAFGFGPHVCLGQHLAKREIKVFFEELLPRLNDISLAGEPKMLESIFVSGLKNLPITYSMT